ncbi:P-loop containing nucleoside triphosphate hydrolase protein [Amylocarpus encephaloides]|uniref:P-loop containing nucleoside triphosphate hydrolase protein n=1 Tax=Amylocarpus encephaloides TaxID=45428 RepID=A0A9P7YCN7_9HELO|nr:P-loop containing nucleoside triphosphate hydrolase protein [Amylocarpus encephaloides]
MEQGTDIEMAPTKLVDAGKSSSVQEPETSKFSETRDGKPTKVDYDAKATKETDFSGYWRVFGYTTLTDRFILGAAILGQIGTGATLPLMIIVFGGLVGDFASPNLDGFGEKINKNVLYLVYIFIARYVLAYFSMLAFRMSGLRISAKIRFKYLTALFALPVSVLDKVPTGQTSTTITSTANLLQLGISDKLGTLIQASAMMLISTIIAFTFSWALTLACCSVLVFIGCVYGFTVPLTMKLNKEVEFSNGKASSIAGEALSSIRMIIASGAEARVSKRYAGWIEESRNRGRRLDIVQGATFSPAFFAIYGVFALAFYLGFKLFVWGKGSIEGVGTIFIVVMSVMMIVFGISQTAPPLMNITKAASAATDFFFVIDAPKPNKLGLSAPEVSPLADIVLDSVNFAYPSRPRSKVLDDLNVRFEAGKITAIVGSSGSGKSTIVGLLQRWYELNGLNDTVIPESAIKDEKTKKAEENEDEIVRAAEEAENSKPLIPLSGTVSVGSHNIDSLDLKWWRSQIGLVQQEPYIFNDTIYKNVEYGLIGSKFENEPAEVKRELVIEACKEAFADEYISKLPQGYETAVGDAGIKLSGGQRQRLAIARSIIKRPTILILDEATSAIDVRGERLVQAALEKVSTGRTTITIAHRLSTIKKADKIIVMQKGKVVEEGNHENLLTNANGPYWSLVNAQKLTMGSTFADETNLVEEKQQTLAKIMSTASGTAAGPVDDKVYKPKGFLKSFGLLLSEQKAQFLWYIALLIGCLGAAAAYPLQAYVLAKTITKTGEAVFLEDNDLLISVASHWALMFFIIAIGVGAAYFIMGATSNVISVNISSTYRKEYFESILAKPVEFYDLDENSAGSLSSRVANDPTQLQELLGINMGMVMIAGLNLVGSALLGFIFGWKLTIVTLAVVCPLVLTAGFFRVRYELQFETMNQAVFAESSKFAAESITAFRTVTALTLEDMICTRYNELLQGHVKHAFDNAKYSTLLFAASDSITLPCMALIFWYGGQLLLSGEYDSFQFFVVYMAVFNGAEGAGSLLSFGPNVAQASAAANRILSFRIREDAIQTGTQELEDTSGGVKIELKDVYFRYPTRDTPIFTGLNLTIEKGQFVGLVGASGSGKSTIVSLLERFYEIQKGRILINGTNVADLDVKGYRRAISLVAQEPTLFQGSIKDNILLGVNENTSDEKLFKACKEAEIHDFITSLPQGYETDVGNKGVALSGGQRQRISIARALIRDPKILLLDEATSSLDSESEKLVQAAFERAAKGRTMVVVAHRLATIQNAGVIFVLGEGKVLETGNHLSLLNQRGIYYQMCQSQALDR